VWAAWGVACVAAVVGCSTVSPAGGAPVSPEQQIAMALEGWLTALARDPAYGVGTVAGQAAGDGELAFELAETSSIPASGLGGWIEALRPDHQNVEYRVAALSIATSKAAADEFDVRFALERRSTEASGLAHVARWQERWGVRLAEGSPAVVVSIHEERRLVFPGTGAQIVCF